jgi:hypothetical protein
MQYTTEAAKYSVSGIFSRIKDVWQKIGPVFLYSYCLRSTFAEDDSRQGQ